MILSRKITLLCILLALGNSVVAQKNNLEKGWEAFNNNRITEAIEHFEAATKNPKQQAKAWLDLCLVYDNTHNSSAAFHALQQFYHTAANPYPYLYALWASETVLGATDRGNVAERVAFFTELSRDPKANPTIRGLALTALGNYYLLTNEVAKAREVFANLHVLDHWSITGKFDNVSGSGFDKTFGPLAHPEADATFRNYAHASVTWFPVTSFRNDRWFDFTYNFIPDNGIAFAQTFVQSDRERDAILLAGVSGSLKIWVNDALVTKIEQERNTGMDVYRNPIHLQKGYNRILLQVGCSEIEALNFMVRLADSAGNLLTNISSTATPQSYAKAPDYTAKAIPFFAETYFQKQVEEHPDDLAAAFLLAKTYTHNQKTFEARRVLAELRKKAPKSAYVSTNLIHVYQMDGNTTDLTKEQEFKKRVAPEHYDVLTLKWNDAIEKEDYAAAERLQNEIIERYGTNADIALMELVVTGNKGDNNAFMKQLDQFYKQYPHYTYFTQAKYYFELNRTKDLKKSSEILEDYLDRYYDYDLQMLLINNYFKMDARRKAEQLIRQAAARKPYACGMFQKFAGIYYDLQEYSSALKWQQKAITLAPYIGQFYDTKAAIYDAMEQKQNAIAAYKKSIYYDPTNYSARKRLRTLEDKKNLFDYIPAYDVDSFFAHAPGQAAYPDENSIVLLDDEQRIVYPEGASEQREVIVAKVFNQAGIDTWKEYNIDYNPYSQRLIVEQAEVLKQDGSKVKAESNDGHIVFTSLAPGDGITLAYRIENYNSGRLARHFWDNFHFNYFVPLQQARYTLVMPESQQIQYRTINTTIEPEIKTIDGLKIYTWKSSDNDAVAYEQYMPPLSDVGKRLEITSVPDWNFIADWYSDLSSGKAKGDYEVKQTVAALFEGKEHLSEEEEARLIYAYIVKNINYSDVPFLHSAFTPQRSSRTLNTKLGDCKDVATLFVAMAKERGLKANLVLVDTRNNGNKDLLVPTVGFNHCIAAVIADGKQYLLELTSPYLPFGALSPLVRHATGLYIPRDGRSQPENITKLSSKTDIPATIYRNTEVTFEQDNMQIKTHSIRTGSGAAGFRNTFIGLGESDRHKTMESSIGSDYKSNVVLTGLRFTNLNNLSDSVIYDMAYTISDGLSRVGSITIMTLPWTDDFSSLSFLSQGTRNYPFALWQMNLGKKMTETITIHLPPGKKLIEIPEDVQYSCDAMEYRLHFQRKDQLLIATRELTINDGMLTPEQYESWKAFLDQISKADHKQYGFK